jgi:hypothetical protein
MSFRIPLFEKAVGTRRAAAGERQGLPPGTATENTSLFSQDSAALKPKPMLSVWVQVPRWAK